MLTPTVSDITTAQETRVLTENIAATHHVTTASSETTEQRNEDTDKTTAAPVIPITYTREQCHCNCIKIERPRNVTAEGKQLMKERQKEIVEEIKQNLTVPTVNLSAT
ncbi:hypothetical protein ACOMHN_046841 [Nucella lapillus]